MHRTFPLLLLICAGLTSAAFAQGGDDRPKGTVGSGAITMEQMQEGLQYLIAKRYGINVNYVLPEGWEVVTREIPGKGQTPSVFSTMSRRKMPNPSDPTNFIFELNIYEPNITAGIDDKDQKRFDEAVGKRFRDFLDAQLSLNIKGKNKVISKANDIVPKNYGPTPRNGISTRPQTTMVPIHYQVPPPKGKGNAAELYTFTGLTGGRIWQLKFLVNADMVKTYEPLIAIIVNNSFALTDKQQSELEANTKAVKDKAKAAGSGKGKS